MKKVIISGATGAIGMALIDRCLRNNWEVFVLCRKNSPRISRLQRNCSINLITCDLSELSSLDFPRVQCDIFYHLGWSGTFGEERNNIDLQMKNVGYTLDAVELAHRLGCSCFVGAGSQAEYGYTEEIINAFTPTNPDTGYGIAKLCAGYMSRLKCSQLGIKHIWTRIFSVYGPYDGENTMVSMAIRKMLAQEDTSFTSGEQYWDYLYSEDAAEALFRLGDMGICNKTYIIASGKSMILRDYINIISNLTRYNRPIGFGKIKNINPRRTTQLRADITDLVKDTGFKPDYLFETGIMKMIKWKTQYAKEVKK